MDNRRNFFKQVVGEIARGVQEIAGPLQPPAPPPAPVDEEPAGPPPLDPAVPTARGATLDELLALADEAGLGARREAVRTLARASVRLTPADDDAPAVAGQSRLGGAPDLAAGVEWPHWRQAPLTFRLQLDLAEVAELLAAGGGAESVALPRSGLLACFSSDETPSGTRLDDAGACRVLLTDPPPADAEPAYGRPARLTRELTLPRTWAAPVVALGLDAGEQAQWTELRRRLAELQGIQPADEEPDREAPHRLLGYPDERRGAMPLLCALLAEGEDVRDVVPAIHPRAGELEPAAARWRLLLQLTLDPEAGWAWGDWRERLYVWAHEDDLAAGDLSRVRAFVQ